MSQLEWVRTRRGELCLQGAHVTQWRAGDRDVLFVSRLARFEAGVPIRGGVPVIFPWFGDDPEGRGRPAHGFARRLRWNVLDQGTTKNGEERVVLGLHDDAATMDLWPHRFAAQLDVAFGDELEIALRVENRDQHAFRCETALHTYFAVGDVERVALRGLEGAHYLDKTDGMRRKVQPEGPLVFAAETDRTYVATDATCAIDDPVLARTIEIEKQHAHSTVVWNPWAERVKSFADLGDDEWRRMLCVESGNVADDAVLLAPGATHTMRIVVRVSPDEGEPA